MSGISRKQAIGLIALALIVSTAFTARYLAGERTPAYLVEQGELHQSVVASGRVRTPRRIELATQIAGRVTAVLASEGAAVEAGQLLVQLDTTELQAARDQARATLAQSQARQRQLGDLSRPLAEQVRRQAEANWQQAKKQQERSRELVERGFYSPAQLDEANRALAVAESQLRSGEAQLASNQPDGAEARVTQSAVEQSRAALALAEPAPGNPLFATTFNDLAGQPQALRQWQGKPLIVNFWARWCGPCRAEIPDFAKVDRLYRGKGLVVLGIGIEDQADPVREFAKAYEMDYRVLIGKTQGLELMQALGNKVMGLPFTVAVDRSGKVILARAGRISPSELNALAEALLK